MANNIGLYAKAIGGSLAAAGTAAITALSDGRITNLEWITIASSFVASLGAVWAIPNMPKGMAKYAKMIAGAIVAGLGALATAYVTGNVIDQTDMINIGIAVLGSLGIVYVTPNAAASDVFLPTVNTEPVIAGPAPDPAASYEEHPDSEDYDPDYHPAVGTGYTDPIPEGTIQGPAARSVQHKYGRKPPIPGRRRLKFSQILKATPAHPLSVDYGKKINDWGMRLNGTYGTCMAAAVANSRLLTTTWLTDKPVNWTDDQVAEFYKTQNPDFPNQDDGMVMQLALEEAHKNGLPELDANGDPVKALAFAEVDLTNPDEVNAAVAIFGGVLWGVYVTQANEDEFDKNQPWDYVPRSSNLGGHAIEGVGYQDGEKFITWATETEFTQLFRQHQAEECWIVIWPEHLGTKQFQEGVDVAALADAYTALTGDPFPVPIPSPQPGPTPGPGPSPAPTPADVVPVSAGLATDVTGWANRCVERKSDSHEDKAVAREWLAEVGNA